METDYNEKTDTVECPKCGQEFLDGAFHPQKPSATSTPRKAKDSFYQFSVSDVSQIDLNRIVREQYESGNLVTLLMDREMPRGLLVHNEFLQNFCYQDQIFVAGFQLYPRTGYSKITVIYEGSTYRIQSYGDTELENARFLPLTKNNSLATIKDELTAARVFTRKITVKVYTL